MDKETFTELVRQNEAKLYRMAMSYTGSLPDASDAVQEALLRAWSKRNTLRDETLFSYVVNNVTNKVNKHYDKVNGQFGAFTLELEVQSGRMDGSLIKEKWRILTKKDRSARYKTDCLNSVFDTYTPNTMHIDDFICYARGVGSLEENGLQNSYFQNDISRMHKDAA